MKTDMTNSPFTVGSKVAVVHHGSFGGRRVNEGTVGKVRKDGKFFLLRSTGEIDARMWTPDETRLGWTAHKSGERYSSEHLEAWSIAHDAERAETSARHAFDKRANTVREFVKYLHERDVDMRAVVDAIEPIMAARSEREKKS